MSAALASDWVDPAEITGGSAPLQGGAALAGSTPPPTGMPSTAPAAALTATDWLDPAAVNPTPVSTTADVAKAIPSGLAVGTAAAAGTPGDLLDFAGNAWEYGLEKAAKWAGIAPSTAPDPTWAGVSASNQALNKGTNILPRTGDILQAAHDDAGFAPYQPQTLAGQFAGKTAEFLPAVAAGPGGPIAKALTAAGSAAGDMAAGAVTKDTYLETPARIAGSLVGGGLPALTVHGYQALAPAWSDAAAKANAAGLILDAAHDPAALKAGAAAWTPGSDELVPGSKPTPFQATGDLGLGDLEKAVQTRDPQQFVSNPYGTGTQQQNAAQVAALQGVQQGGDSMSVPAMFLRQKQALEDAHDAMSDIASSDARGQYDALGGDGTPAQTGQAIKDLVDPQVAAAQQGVRDKVDAIGGQGQPADYGAQIKADLDPLYRGAQADAAGQATALGGADRPDVYSAGLRAQAADAMAQANAKLGDLWDALPSDSGVTVGPLQQFAQNLYAGMGPAERKTVIAPENDIADTLRQYPEAIPFGEARQLDSLITGSMRQELKANGQSQAYRRMVQLKGAYEDALQSSLADRAAADDGAVSAGTMDPSQTLGARIQAASGSGGVPGAPSHAFTPAGTRIGTDYGVVDLGDLTASHAPDGTPNPAFPTELQPRDRSRPASVAQVGDMAANLQPERLGYSTSTTDGAPIVGPDGVVESGNGRVMALSKAYAADGPAADGYRSWLTGQGYDLSGMDRPALVRTRTTPLSDADRIALTQESNAPTVLTPSATERAAGDAGRLSDGLLSSYRGGDVASAENRPFVRGFLEAATEPNERGALVGPDGALSIEGAQRMRNALTHAGYGDSRLVSALAETGDPDIAAFGRALGDNAGAMAQLRRGVAGGAVHPGADLSGHAVEAARVVQRARSTGQPIAAIVDQADAFAPVSREAHALLQAGYGAALDQRFSRARLNGILSDAIAEAQQQGAGGRLFGEPLEAHDLIEGARTRYASRQGAGAADPLADGAGDPGPRAGAARGEGGRPWAGPGGAQGPSRREGRSVLPDVAPAGPPLSQDALDRLAAARQATKDFQATYRKGVGGDILRSDGTSGSYRVPDASVGARVFPKGPAGYQAVRAYERMVGDSADAAGLLHNYAAATLRRDALRPDGTLDPVGYQRWRNGHGEAFRALPPSVQSSFDTAGHAAEALDRFGRFTPETAASLVPGQFFRSGVTGADGVEHLRSLIGADRANAALGDYAASDLRRAAGRPDGTLDTGRYATWRRNHDGALGALPDDVRARFDTAASAGDALKRFGRYSPDLAPANVPELFFAPGKAGRDGVDHFRNLVGDEAANTILSDHVAGELKARASTPDGMLDPGKVSQFMRKHEPALSAFPELAGRFSDAAKASQTVADVAAGRAAALKNLQSTAAGKFMGLSDPSEVRDAVGRMVEANNVTGLRGLMRQAAADPDAVEGVRRAALDHVLRRGISEGTEAGTSGVNQVNRGTFQNLVGENRAALGAVLEPDQMKALDALSADMARQKRTENALKVKGSPNTAADYVRAMKFEPKDHGNVLRELAEGAIGGEEIGGEKGAILGAGAAVLNRIRSATAGAAMRNTYDHVERAVLDPEYMKVLLAKAPLQPGQGIHRTLATRLQRYSMYGAPQAATASQDDGRSSR